MTWGCWWRCCCFALGLLVCLANASCRALRDSPFGTRSIPSAPIYNGNLSICETSSPTCCTHDLEQEMLATTRNEVSNAIEDRIIVLKHIFDQNYHTFEKHNRGAISSSREQLHAMFTRTYGPFYQSHTQIFISFFDNLQQFYTNQTYASLKTILEEFFFALFRTMFSILNPLEKVTKKDFECLRRSMSSLEPFADIPTKMSIQLERSVGTARSLTQALRSTSQILQSILQREISSPCANAAARMTHCALCTEKHPIKPCANLCLNVFKGCLAGYAQLDESWNLLVGSLSKLAHRLKGPYNVISVVIPIAVQISESIMLFQEKGPIISAKVIQKCLRKEKKDMIMKREVGPTYATAATITPLRFTEPNASVSMHMMTSFNERLKTTRGFWRALPTSICISGEWAASSEQHCWNGTHSREYERSVVGDGIRNQVFNPEFSSSQNLSSEDFINEILKISMLSNQLSDIYDGRHLRNETIEDEGSGMGIAYTPIDDEDGDDSSGMDSDLPIVLDIAGSHRDVEEILTTVPTMQRPKILLEVLDNGYQRRFPNGYFLVLLFFMFLSLRLF
uniref:Glypican-6 n=1 Tax=Parascaris univalens TaxID=6257 RepID=A0A915AHK5_PARUN